MSGGDKLKNKICLITVIIFMVLAISNISLGFSVNMSLDKTKELKVNDEIVLTITPSETIVGATFKINYDNKNLKLIGSETNNLSVSENDGKIACAYIDMVKKGTDNLKIKLKIVNNVASNMTFKLEEAKFVNLKDDKSYSQSEISGIDKTLTTDSTRNDTTTENNNNTVNKENNKNK